MFSTIEMLHDIVLYKSNVDKDIDANIANASHARTLVPNLNFLQMTVFSFTPIS